MDVKVDLKDFDKYAKQLGKFAKTAVPHAIRNGLNRLVFEGRGVWQQEIKQTLILRNDFTTRRIVFDKAQGLNVATMKSVLRTPNEYMETTEEGGTELGSTPTRSASGEGRGSGPRLKLVRGPNKLSAISLPTRSRKGNRKQRNAIAVRVAAKGGKKWAYLEISNRNKGLFKITGGSRNPQLHMIWSTAKKRHTIRAKPTLGPAVKRLSFRMDAIMANAMVDQLKRLHILGY